MKIRHISVVLVVVFTIGFSGFVFAKPWEFHKGRIVSHKAKINALRESFSDLVKKSKIETSEEKKKEIRIQLEDTYMSLQNAITDYRKESDHIKYEHPRKGAQEIEKFNRLDNVKAPKVEGIGVFGKMTQFMEELRVVFGKDPEKEDENTTEKKKSDRESKSIIKKKKSPERLKVSY